MNELDSARALLEHGVLGALVVLQFGIILWLIQRLTEKVNGQAKRIARVERQVIQHSGDDSEMP
jgi:hypothetical protein